MREGHAPGLEQLVEVDGDAVLREGSHLRRCLPGRRACGRPAAKTSASTKDGEATEEGVAGHRELRAGLSSPALVASSLAKSELTKPGERHPDQDHQGHRPRSRRTFVGGEGVAVRGPTGEAPAGATPPRRRRRPARGRGRRPRRMLLLAGVRTRMVTSTVVGLHDILGQFGQAFDVDLAVDRHLVPARAEAGHRADERGRRRRRSSGPGGGSKDRPGTASTESDVRVTALSLSNIVGIDRTMHRYSIGVKGKAAGPSPSGGR